MAVVVEQDLVDERRYDGSWFAPKTSNQLKTCWVKELENWEHPKVSRKFFCITTHFYKCKQGRCSRATFGLWAAISQITRSTWKQNSIEKMVSKRTGKLRTCNSFLPFFVQCCMILKNARGWWQRHGEMWSVRGDTMDHVFVQKTTIELKESVRMVDLFFFFLGSIWWNNSWHFFLHKTFQPLQGTIIKYDLVWVTYMTADT